MDTESVEGSNGFELVQSDTETGLLESEGGPNSASTQHTSGSRRTRATAKSSELLRPLFQEMFADEVAPPVGPLVVVASLRKTGNPPKRKLHLLDRDGRAVGCGWSPDLTKVSSMTKDDYDSEVADLFHVLDASTDSDFQVIGESKMPLRRRLTLTHQCH